MAHQMLAMARLFAYMDDLAMVLASVCMQMPLIMQAFWA